MKKMGLLIITALSLLVGFAQEKIFHDPNAEARSVSGFHAIRVSQGIELVIRQGDTEAAAVSAVSKEYRDNIRTEVVAGVLKIYYDTKWYKDWHSDGKKLRAYVSFKQLDELHGSSGSMTTVDGGVHSSQLKIALSSGASFKGDVDAGSLVLDGSSGATAQVSGKVKTASLEASSGTVIHGFELVSETCDAGARSGGNIQVSVNKELVAEASSGGDIQYKGPGVITKVSTGSGGSVKKS